MEVIVRVHRGRVDGTALEVVFLALLLEEVVVGELIPVQDALGGQAKKDNEYPHRLNE